MTNPTMQKALRQLIANDAYAMTFQTMGEYRTALLQHADQLLETPATCSQVHPDSALPSMAAYDNTAQQYSALASRNQPYATGGIVPGGLHLAGEGLRSLHAKPEGEAPQAKLMADANRYVYLASTADWSAIEDLLRRSDAESATELKRDLDKLIDARLKTAITLPLYTAPAAQHADSGAPAVDLPPLPAPYGTIPVYADIEANQTQDVDGWTGDQMRGYAIDYGIQLGRAALAAQSQGAQAALADERTAFDSWVVRVRKPYCDAPSNEIHQWIGWQARAALAAQQAAAPGALTLLNADELAALHRFQETCQDFDSGGYDVDKNMMKRLASIGVIESKGFNQYQFTEFGDYVVENQAASAPGTPEAPAAAPHPIQPLVEDAYGRVRFKRNAIVDHLATDKLNDLAAMNFPEEDWEQLAQLIGYSLDGFGTLSYVKDETYERAAAQPVAQRAAQRDGGAA